MSSEESNKMSKKTPSQDSNSREEIELISTAPDTDANDIEWDLEEMKRAYKNAAEQQWDKYAGG